MRASLAALVAALLLPPAGARAQGPPALEPLEQGFVLSARAGWAVPAGEISGEGAPPLDEVVKSKTPLWLELGYRFDRRLWGALFLEAGRVSVDHDYCVTECDGSSIRFGAEVQLHLAPRGPLDPWLGVGFAFEFLTVDAALDLDGDGLGDVDGELGYAGVELPLLEGGLDLVLSTRLRLGPYAAWSPGQYTSVSVEGGGLAAGWERIRDRAVHTWFQAGLKLTLLL